MSYIPKLPPKDVKAEKIIKKQTETLKRNGMYPFTKVS